MIRDGWSAVVRRHRVATAGMSLAVMLVAPLTAGAEQAAAEGLPRRVGTFVQRVPLHRALPPGLPRGFAPSRVWLDPDGRLCLSDGATSLARGDGGFALAPLVPPPRDGGIDPDSLPEGAVVRQVARDTCGRSALATSAGLFERRGDGAFERLAPSDARGLVWAAADVRGVAYDADGRLVAATPAGVLRRGATGWEFFGGADGLPVSDFTAVAAAPDGTVWFGSRRGAVEWAGGTFRYRQGTAWLPGDRVDDLLVLPDGDVVLATDGGVGWIAARPMTLAAKARHYEEEIDRLVARTEHGFVATAALGEPGDRTTVRRHDNDNDGLWTAMYGAAQCFAYGHDRSPDAKRRADRVLAALLFLQDVTQGGEHAPPPGFPARTVLPGDDPDPNVGQGERDGRTRAHDPLWKALEPRWPRSADGRWWWKADTSSDELDGHFFFFALYHDLVAGTDAERAAVRRGVARLADHLLDHGFRLVDHDGQPTRWGEYAPAALNDDPRWRVERGLNSMSILAYLAIAAHVTGDARYAEAAARLRRDHAYGANATVPKVQAGIGSGNQSDDEMAFMDLYHLVRLTPDPRERGEALATFHRYWLLERPERNPFFDVTFAAAARAAAPGSPLDPTAGGEPSAWIDDAVETLVRLPLDRCQWAHANSHRLDVLRLPAAQSIDPGVPDTVPRGYRVDGRVLPADERAFAHWNTDPWRLDGGGDGRELASGTVFLLPWHMGRYHGFIADD